MPSYTKPNILHSLYGRMFGISADGGLISGDQQIATHTTAAADVNLARSGVSALSSNAQTFGVQAPGTQWIGVEKFIFSGNSSSTLVRTITCTGCTFMTSNGSTPLTATFAGPGQFLALRAISSGMWLSVATNSSVPLA